jgi:hypothetical protein
MIARFYFVTLVFCCCYSTSVFSQSPKRYHHNTFWGRVGLADKFSDKWKWELYYQNRTQNDPNLDKANAFRYHQLTSYTAVVHYQALKSLRISFTPLCYFNTIGLLPQSADNGNRGVKEFRWMVMAEHTAPIGKFTVGHRYTGEYRYRDLVTVNDYVSNYRLRYRGRIEHGLASWKHPLTLMVYDEVFIEFGGAVKNSAALFNQNRLFAGFTYELIDHVKLNIGYIYLVQERSSGKAFDYSNVLSTALTFEGLFSSKRKSKENISDAQPGD